MKPSVNHLKENTEAPLGLDKVLISIVTFLFLLSYPISRFMPSAWGKENGVIECLQVAALFIVSFISLRNAIRMKTAQNKRFWYWSLPLWLLMIGRELNWGRVFYPIQTASGDVRFQKIHDLWYGPIVYPLIALAVISFSFAIFRYKLYTVPYRLWKQHRFPHAHFFLIISAIILSIIAEEHFLYPAGTFALNEELAELFAYLGLLSLTLNIGRLMQKEKTPNNLPANSSVIQKRELDHKM